MTTTPFKSLRLRLLVLASLALILAPALWGQKAPKGDNTRTVTGQVVDKAGSPIPKAVVHLKNTKTLQIQTRIADDSGGFRFNGLNPNTDFEIHAEHDGSSSPAKTISSFDSRKDITISLKIDRK